MAGLRADILSPVKETGTLLGVVSSQAAELCGLKAGTPVVVGGGDMQLGCLGLGVVRPAQTAVLGGTFTDNKQCTLSEARHQLPTSQFSYYNVTAHNVYYVKSCLSDAKCFSGSRYSFRVQELKPLLFHNWPVHGEIAWLFPAPC